VLLRPVLLTLKPLVPRLRSYPEYTPLHGSKAGERGDTGFSKEDILDTHDWEELRHFKVLLEPFYLATKRVERYASGGTHGAIWEVLPAFELL
jgi:hypothetical protein